jgi:transglutaminase-like putative cysteine protease
MTKKAEMSFKINTRLSYKADARSSVVLNVRALHPLSEDILCDQQPIVAPVYTELLHYEMSGNSSLNLSYKAEVSPAYQTIDCSLVQAEEIPPFDPTVLPFLYPSRYCWPDQLSNFATSRFGKYDNAFERVLAITEWITEHVQYVSGSTNAFTTAGDILLMEQGVCRDFAHLGITLCRALDIPARYCSVYAYQLQPQDFHACFEAFIGARWIVFDATRLAPLNGLIKIAHGRDAADTAVSSLFGNVCGELMEVEVVCDDPGFTPFFYQKGTFEGLSLDSN